MMVSPIDPDQVAFFWPEVQRYIEWSQDRPCADMTPDEIKDMCRTDDSWRLLIFDHFDGAAVLRVWDDRLHVVAIGGHLEPHWEREFFEWLVRLARFFGLRFVTLGGRKGWVRLLRPLGFVPIGGPFLGYELQREVEP